ncbi:hypothetical protein WA026_008024 [Henosepilachna vigintioctopunctata]|uniref:Uncharacterized protein n=1 Tax=Henosepilachna vigintioctopunctata TaxID=420089 RepID=A0AAW1TP59_9CUCU
MALYTKIHYQTDKELENILAQSDSVPEDLLANNDNESNAEVLGEQDLRSVIYKFYSSNSGCSPESGLNTTESVKKRSINAYWTKNSKVVTPMVHQIMTRDRFLL